VLKFASNTNPNSLNVLHSASLPKPSKVTSVVLQQQPDRIAAKPAKVSPSGGVKYLRSNDYRDNEDITVSLVRPPVAPMPPRPAAPGEVQVVYTGETNTKKRKFEEIFQSEEEEEVVELSLPSAKPLTKVVYPMGDYMALCAQMDKKYLQLKTLPVFGAGALQSDQPPVEGGQSSQEPDVQPLIVAVPDELQESVPLLDEHKALAPYMLANMQASYMTDVP